MRATRSSYIVFFALTAPAYTRLREEPEDEEDDEEDDKDKDDEDDADNQDNDDGRSDGYSE